MLTLADLDAARAAQQVQQHAPDWFVIWSLRHRRFEAWQCTDPNECRIVCASSATALWDLMQQAELDLWRTTPPAPTPPTPGAASRPGPPLSAAPGPYPSPYLQDALNEPRGRTPRRRREANHDSPP